MAERRTLYVNRPLKNARALIAWANAAGIKKTLPADEMHVTIAFSKEPLDWSSGDGLKEPVTARAIDRAVEPLGDKGAVVLRFDAPELSDRWSQLRDLGAAWDYLEYRPHVTITYDAGDVDLATIKPYDGPLEFGAERFAEIEGEWYKKATASMVGDQKIKFQEIKVRADLVACDSAMTLALDRDSVREMDRDGRMRVKVAHISKATVNPYKGHEIPDWEGLGLDPNKVYYLLRDPEELAKAAQSFNGVQILRKHTPVSADDHQPWEVVGSTGTDAEFDDPYLKNSLSIWAADAIDDIDNESKKELSCGYHYRADMTPGNFNGMRFDGVMREIVGNHVALVEDGRAGPDVVVGDSNQEIAMSDNRDLAKRINAIAMRTVSAQALATYLRPRLALDAKPVGIMAKVFDGVTGSKFKEMKPVVAKRIKDLYKPMLAKDASLEDVEKVLDMLDGHEIGSGDESVSEPQHNAMEAAAHGNSTLDIPQNVGKEFADADKGKTFDAAEGLRGFLKEKGMGEDDINTACSMLPKGGANDEFPPKKEDDEDDKDPKAKDEFPPKEGEKEKDKDMAAKDAVSKPAMDAAIKLASDQTADRVRKEVRATERAIRTAERDVAPYVGALDMAFDSAEQVYRTALEILGVPEAKTVHESALPTILRMQPKAGARPIENASLGMDSARVKDFNDRFPNAARIGSV